MRWIAVLFLGLASLAYAPEARACSCMRLTPSEGLTSSYAVFTGEVSAIEKNTATKFGGLEVTLRVKRMWKGEPSEELKVHTAGSSAACGYSFVKGTTYLVYAVRDEADPLRVSLCSRTAPLDQAKEDLDYLGKPEHDFEGKKRRRDCSVASGEAGTSAVASFALLLVLATFGIRRLT
jgi:MYXO-CTERM domain-containing protein